MVNDNERNGLEILCPDKRGYINFYPTQKDNKPVKKTQRKESEGPH